LTETLDGIQQIRAANREQHYLQRVIDSALRIKHDSAAFSWKSDAASRLSFFVFLMGFDLFRAVSMLMVVFSDLSVGEMMAVFAYLWFMMGPVQEALNIQYAYYGARAALERINRLLSLSQEPQYPHQENPFPGQRGVSVQLDELRFSYGNGEPVLNGVSLNIEAGERVALVGASGGGKSTLVQVLLGLYPPDEGEISFNGVAVQNIGLDVVRDHVATVLQHPVLFNDTVRNNLTLGRDYPESVLWQAIENAQLGDVVRDMPDKLDSVLGRQGVRLSGGQRQRLAIARLLLGDPQVVIFDEATSALDTQSESNIMVNMREVIKDRTTFIIAHRLSTVMNADKIIVLYRGNIVEEGTHRELVDKGGMYYQLIQKQIAASS
jgi:ATP-binding cassette subfamily C protein